MGYVPLTGWTLWLYAIGAALAADSTYAGADRTLTPSDEPVSSVSAELGGTWTSGNTDGFTVNGGLHGAHRWGSNRLRLDLAANLGQSYADANGDGHLDDAERAAGRVETAHKLSSEARYDRFVGARQSVYGLGGALVDPFAGYERRTHAQAGVSYQLVQRKTTSMIGELGADVAREDFVAGVDPKADTVLSARALLGVDHAFNPSVSLSEQAEVYENLLHNEDVRVLSKLSLTSALAPGLSLKLSHQLALDTEPVEGFRPVDQITMATFVATIL